MPLNNQYKYSGESYDWSSNATVFDCLLSHLKTIEMVGGSYQDDPCKALLHFLRFLLRNARVLEKMKVVLKNCGTAFVLKVSQELLSFSKCSQHAIIEFLSYN